MGSCCHHAVVDAEARRNRPVPVGAIYTCPMHPDVRIAGGGDCPMCGMSLEPEEVNPSSVASPDDGELKAMTFRFWVCAGLSFPLFLNEMLGHLFPDLSVFDAVVCFWGQILLATPVVLWGAAPLFVRGFSSVIHRHLNMFTLVSLGIGVSYLYSAFVSVLSLTVEGGESVSVYFESASVMTTLVLLGQVLELRARGKTSEALRALLDLAPKKACLIDEEGVQTEVPVEEIRVDDYVRVRPGEKIPVDGLIVEGTGIVDESAITGEAMFVNKGAGDKVSAATINTDGAFVMLAQRVGRDTLLGQILSIVAKAQRTRAPVQRMADRVAAIFVPAVILVSFLTAVVWWMFGPDPHESFALVNAIAVLIIACPCALGLATPMSIVVGTGRAAQMGILVREAVALENMEKTDTVVFDKTGTLTEGRPTLIEIVAEEGFDKTALLRMAASLEQSSQHPYASALLVEAEAQQLGLVAAYDFSSAPGMGLTGTVARKHVAVGSADLMRVLDCEVESIENKTLPYRNEGSTVILIAVDGVCAGFFVLADRLKTNAAEAIALLRAEGLGLVMLTGDHPATAHRIAKQLGIESYEAGVTPGRKAEIIQVMQESGKRVVMAGDGINDAPALSVATVGVAMGNGTDVAIESAGMTLVKGDLTGIVRARRLSAMVMKNVRQNLFFAFVYNLLGVPLAAGLLYPVCDLLLTPEFASAAMALSSVSVIGNALRLRRMPLK